MYCQSCGMPMTATEQFGTEKGGIVNKDYCVYCFKDGAFTQNMTMDEMIEHCAGFVEEYNKDSNQKLTKEQAVAQMKMYFPKLKRWAAQN